MASSSGTLYIGMTNNIEHRAREHRNGLSSFTKKYGCHRLVYFEHTHYVLNAIAREKEIKNMSRVKKEALINELNPTWGDLTGDFKYRIEEARGKKAVPRPASRVSE